MQEIITTNSGVTEENKTMLPMKNMPRIFFMMIIFCMLMYGGILPFNYIATSFLLKTW